MSGEKFIEKHRERGGCDAIEVPFCRVRLRKPRELGQYGRYADPALNPVFPECKSIPVWSALAVVLEWTALQSQTRPSKNILFQKLVVAQLLQIFHVFMEHRSCIDVHKKCIMAGLLSLRQCGRFFDCCSYHYGLDGRGSNPGRRRDFPHPSRLVLGPTILF